MRPNYFVKSLLMIVALAVVIFTIRALNQPNMEHLFASLGLSPGAPDSPGVEPGWRPLGPGDERYNVCKTRIESIEFSSGRKIAETKDGLKMHWMAFDPQAREIGYMDVERWLSHHCQIVVHAVDPGAVHAGGKVGDGDVVIHFVDGSQSRYERYSGDVFSEGPARAFKSEDLTEALRELQQIAQMTPANGR